MTIKLTYEQANALYVLFKAVVVNDEPQDIAESLVKDLMMQVLKKLTLKMDFQKKKDGYSLSLTDVEAKAYYVYFNQRHLGDGWIYENNLIQQHVNDLDRIYA